MNRVSVYINVNGKYLFKFTFRINIDELIEILIPFLKENPFIEKIIDKLKQISYNDFKIDFNHLTNIFDDYDIIFSKF